MFASTARRKMSASRPSKKTTSIASRPCRDAAIRRCIPSITCIVRLSTKIGGSGASVSASRTICSLSSPFWRGESADRSVSRGMDTTPVISPAWAPRLRAPSCAGSALPAGLTGWAAPSPEWSTASSLRWVRSSRTSPPDTTRRCLPVTSGRLTLICRTPRTISPTFHRSELVCCCGTRRYATTTVVLSLQSLQFSGQTGDLSDTGGAMGRWWTCPPMRSSTSGTGQRPRGSRVPAAGTMPGRPRGLGSGLRSRAGTWPARWTWTGSGRSGSGPSRRTGRVSGKQRYPLSTNLELTKRTTGPQRQPGAARS